MNKWPWVGLFALAACGSEPLETLQDVRTAQAEAKALHAEATLSAYTEADGSRFGRRALLDWWAADDFTLTVFEDSSDAVAAMYHLAGTALTHIGADSIRTVSEVDPAGDVIPNYYTGLLIPPMLQDTAWFTALAGDSTLVQDGMNFTTHAAYDRSAEDYHPETRSVDGWTFDAETGLPLRFEDVWYRGDLAYGRELTVTWAWTNEAPVAWSEPEWAREPAVEREEVDEEEDWYAATMAALPAGLAPALRGKALDGSDLALSDFAGQITFLDFWYIGCGPCMQALPHLAELQTKYGDRGFNVVGANSHQDAATISRYLGRRDIDLPQLVLDSLPAAWPVRAYPTWFLVGPYGEIIDRGMGFDPEGSVAYLDSLIEVSL